MKYNGGKNEIVIDIDEAKYLAKQTVSWNGNTLQDAKIQAAKAIVELYNVAKSTHTNIAYGESTEF